MHLSGDPGRVLPGSDLTEHQFSALPADERRRIQRLMRNRLSAALHRQRQRAHIECLEQQVAELAALVHVFSQAARDACSSCTCGAACRCLPAPLMAVTPPSLPGVLGFTASTI